MTIVVSPFSNGLIRDWPPEHYADLIGLLLEDLPDEVVRVVGTANQRKDAYRIVRNLPADRVKNDCGLISWDAVTDLVRDASCVIGNNSGIPHLAGFYKVPTVCIFGGSHQRMEWRPLGPNVVVMSRTIGCSPCHIDHRLTCLYDKACLREIAPREVADAVLALIEERKDRMRQRAMETDGALGA